MRIFHNKIILLTFFTIYLFIGIGCEKFNFDYLTITNVEILDTYIKIDFSHEVDKNKFRSNFEFTKDNKKINGDFEFSNNSILFYPFTDLKEIGSYKIYISSSLESKNFNSLEKPFTYEFNIQNTKEFSFVKHELNKDLILNFTSTPDLKSFQDNFNINPTIDYFLFADNKNNSIKIIFKEEILKEEFYTVTINKSLIDTENNKLKEKVQFNFCTNKNLNKLECKIFADAIELLDQSKVYQNIDSSKPIKLEFNQEIENKNLNSSIAIIPDIFYSICVDPNNKKLVTIDLNNNFYSDENYLLVIKNFNSIFNNQLEDKKCFTLKFNNNKYRIPQINKLYIKNSQENFYCINSVTEIPTINFDKTYFLPNTENSNGKLIVIFDLFDSNNKIDIFSIMENLSFNVSNSCLKISPEKIYELTTDEISSLNIPVNQNQQVIAVDLNMTNFSNNGFVKIKFYKSIQDTNKNNYLEDIIFSFNKL